MPECPIHMAQSLPSPLRAESSTRPAHRANCTPWTQTTGELAWTFNASMGADLPPTVLDGVVYLTAVNTAHALDEATGAELWSYSTERFPARNFPAVVSDGVYYFSPDNYLYALNAQTGETIWVV